MAILVSVLSFFFEGAFIPQNLRSVDRCNYPRETDLFERQHSGANLLRRRGYNDVDRRIECGEAREEGVEEFTIGFLRNAR